jgi:enoyl-CoA hydratase
MTTDTPGLLSDTPTPGVRLLLLDRPETRNALSNALLQYLADALAQARDDAGVACVVLAGAGKVFASGVDIRELADRDTVGALLDVRPRYWDAIRKFPKPIIIAVEGYALGGGCELAMHGDIVVAGETAQFGQPETSLGIIPGAGGTQRLVRLVGHAVAMRMVLAGERLPATEAKAAGLISEVVPAGEALARALAIATGIATRPALAMRLAKEMVLAAPDIPLEWGLILERRNYGALLSTEDFHEGVVAFLEKRRPIFKGC